MPEIQVCKVLNKIDESNIEDLVVCSIWKDVQLKVYIVKNNSIMLFGEEGKDQIQKFAKTFDKTVEAYLEESKDILSGKKSDIDFFLTDSKFTWKRQKRPLGTINVKSVEDMGCLISFMLILMEEYSQNKRALDGVQKEYQKDKLALSETVQKLDDIQIIKDQMENDLYKKFALVLNSKKAAIRELRDKIQKLENSKSIYNELTDDESDSDAKKTHKGSSHSNQKRAQKQSKNTKSYSKRMKDDVGNGILTIEKNSKGDVPINKLEPIPSTSSDMQIINKDEDEETPDLLSGESDCDLELKFDEEKLEENKKKSAIPEDNSEEEMF